MSDTPSWADAPSTPTWASGTADTPSWADAAPNNKPDSKSSFGANAAAVGDLILGTPAWLAKMGQTGVTDVVAAVSGDPHPLKSGREATEQDWQNESFLQAPLQTMFGVNQENTAVGKVMGKVGDRIQSWADSASQKTGNPETGEALKQIANIVMAKAGDILLGGKGKEKSGSPEALTAEQRLAETKPTGVTTPHTPTPEELAAIEKGMPIPDASKPIQKESVVAASKRKKTLAPGEHIAHANEGDLSHMDTMPTHELPPIWAYEPSPHVEHEIHDILTDPELHSTPPDQMDAAREIAAEKIATVIGDDARKQSGKIDPKLLARLAGVTGGSAAGAYVGQQDPLIGALAGAGLGFALVNVGSKMHELGAGSSLKGTIDALKPSVDPVRKMAADAMAAKDANIEAAIRRAASVGRAMDKAIPAERRAHIGLLMSAGKLDTLTPSERFYADNITKELNKIGSEGQEAGALPNLMTEYGLPLMWNMKDKTTKSFFDELMRSGAAEKMSASDFTPFSLKRSVPDYLSGMAGGLKPLTTDPAALLRIYSKSVTRATENAKALSYLKSLKTPEGYAVEPEGKRMPREYVTDHKISGLEGFGVHPDMVESLKLGFDGYEPGMVGRGLLAAAFTAKRLIVSFSTFHAVSELAAYAGAGGNPFGVIAGAAARGVEKVTKTLIGKEINIPYRSAVDKAFDAYHQGGAGDYLDFLIRNGLKKGAAIEDTIGLDQFRKMTHWLDEAVGMNKIAPFTKIDEGLHAFTFGYIQSGVKMATAMRLFEKELIDPKNAGKDVNQIAADVASFSNSMAGGLNFPRIIEGMKSEFGRALAGDIFSKRGLTKLQIGMLAPDWFYSTLRAWTQAVPGLSETAGVGRLHRAYIARSVVYTLVISDAANVYYSGHHLWENDFRTKEEKKAGENPNLLQRIHYMTQIDMGDGTRVNPNKHLYEFIHMLTDFPSFAMNKLNPVVSEPTAALMNKQWLSPKWTPKITVGGTATQQTGDYLKWAVKQNTPISLQQLNSGANYGIVGFPSSGLTPEKRAELKQVEKELKHERGIK